MLAAYGAVSLTAGIGLLVASLAVYWATSADLILALFRGSPVDVAIGLYYVVPIALAGLFSLAGLVLELVRRQQ